MLYAGKTFFPCGWDDLAVADKRCRCATATSAKRPQTSGRCPSSEAIDGQDFAQPFEDASPVCARDCATTAQPCQGLRAPRLVATPAHRSMQRFGQAIDQGPCELGVSARSSVYLFLLSRGTQRARRQAKTPLIVIAMLSAYTFFRAFRRPHSKS